MHRNDGAESNYRTSTTVLLCTFCTNSNRSIGLLNLSSFLPHISPTDTGCCSRISKHPILSQFFWLLEQYQCRTYCTYIYIYTPWATDARLPFNWNQFRVVSFTHVTWAPSDVRVDHVSPCFPRLTSSEPPPRPPSGTSCVPPSACITSASCNSSSLTPSKCGSEEGANAIHFWHLYEFPLDYNKGKFIFIGAVT